MDIYLKEIISSARFILNPIAEVVNLWDDNIEENVLLSINFHPS